VEKRRLSASALELDDIQAGVLRPRPAPYVATYILFHIDHTAGGRELLKRLGSVVASAAEAARAPRDAWVSVALTFQGLQALHVPQAALDTFAPEFRQGMAARARDLGDVGESDPANWEKPLGSPDVHVVVTVLAPDRERLDAALARARKAYQEIGGITAIWRQDCHALPNEKEAFGFRDGISHPAIEGSGVPGTNPEEPPLKAGEFVLGYADEMSEAPSLPQPDVLGRNGSYVVFRKLHQRVAAFRQYLRANAADAQTEELLAAKMMGRWRSGAPLALCPLHDDPGLGGDAQRNNAFGFKRDDAIGYKTPAGSHIRRMNPRDADVAGVARIHRMIRRGTSYGPLLPEGVLDDDGVDRGLMFAFIGTHLDRQFEFVQSEWMNNSEFFSGRPAKDPVAGANDDAGTYDIPRRPLAMRLQGLPRFVVTRGGEYCFLPGLRALRWLADRDR
jgi:Dyp-type peroxidase family